MLDIFVREDLIENGFSEFGTSLEKSEFYIVAETEQGQRLRLHNSGITNHDYSSEQCIAVLERLITKIKNHIKAGGRLNKEYWEEIEPRYGSARYIQLDNTGIFYHREKLEAHK